MQMDISKSAFRALLESAVLTLNDYSIGFVLPKTGRDVLDAELGGSGTLVSIDEVHGILTARHVIEHLRKSDQIGLVLPSPGTNPYNNVFRTDECSDLSFCCQGWPADGPDLGILIPSPPVLSSLRAKKSFYNLSKRQERMLHKPERLEHGFWVLSGFAGEWTGDGSPQGGFQRVKFFKGMYGEGKVTEEYNRDDFDYLVFEALYNELYESPNSYGGYSGGALWHFLVKPDGDKLQVADRLLSGVAFYQSEKKTDGSGHVTREITCHGRRSVYQALIDKVRAQRS